METLKDGKDGFNSAAELLEDNSRSELASQFREFSQQRGRFYQQLETLAAEYGNDLEVSGSIAGKLHQALMSVRDSLSGDDPGGVLEAAESGEDHAVSTYEDALEQDISPVLSAVVQRQLGQIRTVHDRLTALRDSA
ncbi:MAG TPA: PA2169 family four-helix-bundle protein [Acidimicrobiia bacterium]|nr:PA2169 family four-helix-bundle protein [Acidimicrobiia bacterium]